MAKFIDIPSNPIPDGATAVDFRGADGGYLRGALFPHDGAKGTFIIMGGRCEFIEKYFEVVNDLKSRGFAAASMDWRGQGQRP